MSDIFKNIFRLTEKSYEKPPLILKQAIAISIIVPVVGLVVAIIVHFYLYVTVTKCIVGYLIVCYLAIGMSWSFLDWNTRALAIKGHNAFTIIAVLVILLAIIFGKDHVPFPVWGIIILIVAGILGYSVMGICAIKNFIYWRRGILGKIDDSKNSVHFEED